MSEVVQPPSLPPKGHPTLSLVPQTDPGLNTLFLPATPTTPLVKDAEEYAEETTDRVKKKVSPLSDLVESEKTYVELLAGIIRKVAAAWSRTNLPPPELDSIFRSIEAVYKANRSLHVKLKEIGSNPSSPKALGDLLMRWIDDLESPYNMYCARYCSGFDDWSPVQSNAKLALVLETFSESNPPPQSSVWTLDELFLLPRNRLKYYRKLYSRLLKSTTPGRSDHRLLVGALDKLDKLLDTHEARENVRVGADREPPSSVDRSDFSMPPPSSSRSNVNSEEIQIIPPPPRPRSNDHDPTSSASSSAHGSSSLSGERLSRDTVSTSISRASTNTLNMPITDLERRLSTERTLDIFTMKPRSVRLHMSPPNLTYTRHLRLSMDVTIRFTPRSTGQEVVHPRAHLYLLSDLFLICDRMTTDERAQSPSDGPDMWLAYPPLAGKVLRVTEVPEDDTVLQISIMRKEILFVQAESANARNYLSSELKECIEFASSVGPTSKGPVPPVPSLPPSINTSPVESPARLPGISPAIPTPQPPPSQPKLQIDSQRAPLMDHPHSAVNSQMPSTFGPGQVMRSTSMVSQLSNMSLGPPPPFQQQPLRSAPGPNQYNQFPGPSRPPSEPSTYQNGVRHSNSVHSLHSQYDQPLPPPPLPNGFNMLPKNNSTGNLHAHMGPPFGSGIHAPQPRTILPSQFNSRASSAVEPFSEPSPPQSPVEEPALRTGPVTQIVSAQMKCKVFKKQHHAQWKALGAAKLKLYREEPTNVKQLVVEAENKDKSVLISTIVLTDGVERVGKTGVAIELSDKGTRTGIVYMIQLRNETSAGGLFDSLLMGSERAGHRGA